MRLAWRTVLALVLECALAWGTVAMVLWWWHPVTIVLGVLVIATRQHALFILYHDAVHGLIHPSRRLNDAVINAFVGVPQLLPVNLYRGTHLVHHQTLGTTDDPERVLLYAGQSWNYHPLPLAKLAWQLAGDLLLWNNLVTAVLFFREKARKNPRLRFPKVKVFAELYVFQAVFWTGVALCAWWWPELTIKAALLWFVPLLTLTQLIQKVRSFAEHAALEAHELSYSWRPGLLGRVVLWPYNIQFHREHHTEPAVPWFELAGRFSNQPGRRSRQLVGLLWNGRMW